MVALSSQVDVTAYDSFSKSQDRRICFSVPCIRKREREDKKRTEQSRGRVKQKRNPKKTKNHLPGTLTHLTPFSPTIPLPETQRAPLSPSLALALHHTRATITTNSTTRSFHSPPSTPTHTTHLCLRATHVTTPPCPLNLNPRRARRNKPCARLRVDWLSALAAR